MRHADYLFNELIKLNEEINKKIIIHTPNRFDDLESIFEYVNESKKMNFFFNFISRYP